MRTRAALATALALGLSACAKPGIERSPNVAAPAAGEDSASTPGEASTAPDVPAPAGAAPGVASPVAAPGTGPGAATAAPERHGPPLPELSVKSFGLHVGGSSADAAARGDFLRVLESAAPNYLDCYRAIEVPGSVGTFGADLTIGAAGGKPRVGKPRTKLRGEEFQACMVRVLEGVSFARTPSGRAVVVSYSVKFNFDAPR